MSRSSPRSRSDLLGVGWVLAAGFAVILPALLHGGSFGPYQFLGFYELFAGAQANVHGTLLQGQDVLLLSIPWHALSWTEVHAGHLPLWNPYNLLGLPLAFNWESAAFSLPSLVSYLAPLNLVLTVSVACNLLVAGTGVYVLCRILGIGAIGAATAGTVFELSGPFVSLLGWQDSAVMCWAGWLFALAILVLRGRHRLRDVCALAAVLAMAGYAGQLEDFVLLIGAVALFVSTIVVAGLATRRPLRSFVRPLRDLLLAGVAGFALLAPLALPGIQLAGSSVRSQFGPTDDEPAAVAARHLITGAPNVSQALSIHDVTHLIFQSFDGLPIKSGVSPGVYWFSDRAAYIDSAAYVGVIALVLAVVAIAVRRRNVVVLALAAVTACAACLVFVQPVVVVADHLPLVGTFLWNRALIPMCFGLAVLAGIGADVVARRHTDPRVQRWLLGAFGASSVALAALWLFGRGRLPAAEAAVRAHSFIWPAVGSSTGLCVALALWWPRSRPVREATPLRRRAGPVATAVLLGAETAFLLAAVLPYVSSSNQVLPSSPASVALQRAVGSALVGFGTADCSLGIKMNLNAAYGVDELASYDPMTPLAYFSSWRAAGGQPGTLAQQGVLCPAVDSVTLARRFGVSLILEPARVPGPPGTVFEETIGDQSLYRVPGAALATLTPLGPRHVLPGPDAQGKPVGITRPDPSSWTLQTDSSVAQVLRLRLTDVPGWHASIDGRPLTLSKYSGIMLEAVVPAGRHEIELHYWPATFSVGIGLAAACVTVFAAAGTVALLAGRRRRSRRRSRSRASDSPGCPTPAAPVRPAPRAPAR